MVGHGGARESDEGGRRSEGGECGQLYELLDDKTTVPNRSN